MKKIIVLTLLLSVATPTFGMMRILSDAWEACKDMSNEMSVNRIHPENRSNNDRGLEAVKDIFKFVEKITLKDTPDDYPDFSELCYLPLSDDW